MLIEVKEAVPDPVRRTLLDSPYQGGKEDGARSSLHDHGHDLRQVMTSGENQGHGSEGLPHGTRNVSRARTDATQAFQSDAARDVMQLSAVTLNEIKNDLRIQGQSRDQSYEKGQISNGRYTSRDRSTSRAGYRPPSKNGGRDRSQSQGHDPRYQRSSGRDSTDSADHFQSYRRAENGSPRRTSGHQKEFSETRNSRLTSRGHTDYTSRPTSGLLLTDRPEMEPGVNCRGLYNPLKEKRCFKCYPTADHHEFLCKNYRYYTFYECTKCGKGHHFDFECKDREELFPSQVGESHSLDQHSSPEAENSSNVEFSLRASTNSFLKANSASTQEDEFPVQTDVSFSASDLLTKCDSDEKDEKLAPKAGDQSSDTADAKTSITSNTAGLKTDSASNSSLPSYASTSRDGMIIPRISGTSTPTSEVSESFVKDLEQDWMDQIKQSHCSESSKSKDLDIIKSMAVCLDLFRDHIPARILEISQATDSHLGKIWGTLRRANSNTSKKFPYYLLKNSILYRKYMLEPRGEKHVICLSDDLLAVVIHLLHVNHAHSAFTETRGIFQHYYHHRNASRMIRSYIKACSLCAKRPAK
jgi:hypothetical protein